jgi:hypothetical protein
MYLTIATVEQIKLQMIMCDRLEWKRKLEDVVLVAFA